MKLSEKLHNFKPANMDDSNEELEKALQLFFEQEKSVDKTIQSRQERTRNHVTTVILWTFCGLVLVSAIVLFSWAAWGNIEKSEVLTSTIMGIFGVFTPIVTFVLGYYYATRPN